MARRNRLLVIYVACALPACDVEPQRKASAATATETAAHASITSTRASSSAPSEAPAKTPPAATTSATPSASAGPGPATPAARSRPACDVPFSPSPPERHWSRLGSRLVRKLEHPGHRGRDALLSPGEPQWLIAKFTYGGLLDKDLEGENVHVYVLRDCRTWESLGEATTSRGHDYETQAGVDDAGGRVFFQVPEKAKLGLGTHRVRFVVDGDGTAADLFVEVVEKKQPIFYSDVDGTLTAGEFEEVSALLEGELPAVHPDAAAVMNRLADRGIVPVYVTARPEWLTARTRELLDKNGFPRGIIVTSSTGKGALGSAAGRFKWSIFERIGKQGFKAQWAFGNLESDAEAYEMAGIMPKNHRVFYRFTDSAHGGRRIESYKELLDDPSF